MGWPKPIKILDERLYNVRMSDSPGGVARNICDAYTKISSAHAPNVRPIFLTAVGDDDAGRILRASIGSCSDYIQEVKGASSAQCTIVLDARGDCKLLLGDMGVHQMITPKMVSELEDVIKEAPIMVLDGNLSLETMNFCLELATRYKIPVLYEPTDQPVAAKPFQSKYWSAIKCITPNLSELKKIAGHFGYNSDITKATTKLQTALIYGKIVAQRINTVIITLAEEGILIFRRNSAVSTMNRFFNNENIQIRHYPVPGKVSVLNVSGAGDCFTAGLIYGILQNNSEEKCISLGFNAATAALQSKSAVPHEIRVSNSKLAMFVSI